MTSIRTTGLTKDFGDLRAVDNLNLDLPHGGVTGFVGPNGAGKSTTIRMLLGLVEPTSGQAEVLGRSIKDPSGYLHRVGALIEAPAFYPGLTGVENLRVFATLGGHDRRRIPEMLDIVGLSDRGTDRYKHYSLGMKQRLGIALALLPDPDLLVLDEPTNGLTRSAAIAIAVGAAYFILGEALVTGFWDTLGHWGPSAAANALAVGGPAGGEC